MMMRLSSVLVYLSSVAGVLGAESPYSIVIDGGSTGSRLHVFEFVSKNGVTECVRRGSARANQPLSGFARLPHQADEPVDAAAVAAHLMPAFQYAADAIPKHFHANTRVWYAATAGMRLLEEDEQEAIYQAVFQGLLDRPDFVFRGIQRDDIGTLSGDLEGYYGAVAANYLKGTINADLEMNHMPTTNSTANPIGALDMGGSSTQIVFLPQKGSDATESCPNTDNGQAPCGSEDNEDQQRMEGSDFFSTSYLAYGVDQFRMRLWNTWIEEHNQQAAESDACGSEFLLNPCAFSGYQFDWEGHTFIGTGDAEECIRQVQRLIPHPEESVAEGLGVRVGGVEHPPVQGKFFAMSLYFFTLDSLRELSTNNKDAYEALNLSWPNPSIQELHDALDGLCGRAWEGDLEDIQHTAHAYTRAEVLPHRCLESVYMVTLLRDGFGFSPESRDITFTFLVDGSEVEWSLGMALSLRMEAKELEPAVVEDSNHTSGEQEFEEEQDLGGWRGLSVWGIPKAEQLRQLLTMGS